MKLVIAEEVKKKFERCFSRREMFEAVDTSAYVHAIPIEWLCRKYLDVSSRKWSATMRLVVNKIIRDWEKEN